MHSSNLSPNAWPVATSLALPPLCVCVSWDTFSRKYPLPTRHQATGDLSILTVQLCSPCLSVLQAAAHPPHSSIDGITLSFARYSFPPPLLPPSSLRRSIWHWTSRPPFQKPDGSSKFPLFFSNPGLPGCEQYYPFSRELHVPDFFSTSPRLRPQLHSMFLQANFRLRFQLRVAHSTCREGYYHYRTVSSGHLGIVRARSTRVALLVQVPGTFYIATKARSSPLM